jgi:hypothetical protein
MDDHDPKKEQKIWELTESIHDIESKLRKLKLSNRSSQKTSEQKQDEKHNGNETEWKVLSLIKRYLLVFAVFDFTCQVVT